MASDVKEMELAQGVHYHAWALDETTDYLRPIGDKPGRAIRFLRYSASRQPHLSRATARRHAKQMAEPEYGKAGYMALVCDGGAACPFMFDSFKAGFNPYTLKMEGAGDDS